MKRIITALLCGLLLLCLNPVVQAETESSFNKGDFTYVLKEDGTAMITAWNNRTDTKVTIPSELDGHPVSVSNAFQYHSNLTDITIPDSITNIGKRPFLSCENLAAIHVSQDHPTFAVIDGILFEKPTKQLICCPPKREGKTYTIPKGIQSIADYAFYRCSNLTEIMIPDTVTVIGSDAFCRCSGLSEITIPETITSIGEGVFSGCSSLTRISIPGSITSIGNGMFYGCNSLTEIILPGTVAVIGEDAFRDCSSLTHIMLPDALGSIEAGTFSGCSSLTDIAFPDSITSIGYHAFENCSSLTEIILPDSGVYIGDYAFENCVSLASVTFPNSVSGMGRNPFAGCGVPISVHILPDHPVYSVTDNSLVEKQSGRLVSYLGGQEARTYTVPNDIRIIGDSAFMNCMGLKEITLPYGLTTIENSAFNNSGLKTITIPDSVMSIEGYTFARCDFLKEIVLPAGITSIENNLFAFCPMAHITIPDGVTSIGDNVFFGCMWLTDITIPASVESIGKDVFQNCTRLNNITVARDSYAYQYCKEHGLNYTYLDSLDWLNN